MRSAGIIFFILLLIVSCDTERSFSVPEKNYFIKFYGEEGEQEGVDFVINPDGTIVMVGNTERPGVLSQIYVVKVDANGHELWNRKFGLPDKSDKVKDVELHPDGRIVIVGETEMAVGNKDVFLGILSQDGLLLDSIRPQVKTYDINFPPIGVDTDEVVSSVTIVSDGFIVSGASTLLTGGRIGTSATRDAMHLRFDNSLDWINDATGLWSSVSGQLISDDYAVRTIEVDPGKLYYVFGSSNYDNGDGTTDYDVWVFGLGSTGGKYAGPDGGEPLFIGDGNDNERLGSVELVTDLTGSSYLLSGISTRTTGFSQTHIVQLTQAGSLGSISKRIEIKPTDIGTNAVGRTKSIGRINNTFLLLSNDLNQLNFGSSISLQRLSPDFSSNSKPALIYGGEGDDFAGSVAELPNERILLMGTMTVGQSSTIGQKKMVLMKLNSEGKLAE